MGTYTNFDYPRLAYHLYSAAIKYENGLATRIINDYSRALNHEVDSQSAGLQPYSDPWVILDSFTIIIILEKNINLAGYKIFAASQAGIQNIYYTSNIDKGLLDYKPLNEDASSWTDFGSLEATNSLIADSYRSEIASTNIDNINGIKIVATPSTEYSLDFMGIHALHLYGNLTESIIQYWHPTQDTPVDMATYFDYGDIDNSVEDIKEFRIKNISLDKMIKNISFSIAGQQEQLLHPIKRPDSIENHLYSVDQLSWLNYLVIPSLSSPGNSLELYPGELSQIIYFKRGASLHPFRRLYDGIIKATFDVYSIL